MRRLSLLLVPAMLAACQDALPVDVAVCAAAVADWRVKAMASQKLKKEGGSLPALELAENPDILSTLSRAGRNRPTLVVGFAAETEKVVAHARAKLARKGCDWIVANDVSGDVMAICGCFSEGARIGLTVKPSSFEACLAMLSTTASKDSPYSLKTMSILMRWD